MQPQGERKMQRHTQMIVTVFFLIALTAYDVDGSDNKNVIPVGQILDQIKKSEPVEYNGATIRGNLHSNELDLEETQIDRGWGNLEEHITLYGIKKDAKIIKSKISIKNCVIMGVVDFNNIIFEKSVDFGNTTIEGYTSVASSI